MSKLSFTVLRYRDFRFLLLTRVMAVMALQAQAVIVGWQVYSITKSPFLLGLTGLTEAVPAILCALFAGHIVDISHPQRVFLACMSALFLNTFILMLVAGGHIGASENFILYYIFFGVFLSGLARSFAMPAAFSILPRIVPRAEIPAASAWQSSMFQVGAISGPAIAGLLYGGYGADGAWIFPVLIMTLGLLTVSLIRLPDFVPKGKTVRAFESMKQGWRFIRGHEMLLKIMALDMFAVLFGGAVAMLPAFADQVLQTGPEGLGALRAAPAIGSMFTATFLALRPMQVISIRRLLIAVAGFGICMIGFGLSKIFWLSIIFLTLSGAFDSVSMVTRATLMQLLTPEDMRGRVSSVNSIFIISSNEIGAFESGLAAKLLGLVPSVIFGGLATLSVVGWAAKSKKFREMAVRPDAQN